MAFRFARYINERSSTLSPWSVNEIIVIESKRGRTRNEFGRCSNSVEDGGGLFSGSGRNCIAGGHGVADSGSGDCGCISCFHNLHYFLQLIKSVLENLYCLSNEIGN